MKITVDLNGPDGNAFALLAIAKNICKKTNQDPDPIMKKMTSGDYDNLVKVFKDNFKHLVKFV